MKAYERVLRDSTSQHLIDCQRQLPSEATAAELERRGVVLWHHSLRREAPSVRGGVRSD